MPDQNVIAEAYNTVKMEGDPHYDAVQPNFRIDLETRADGVDRTGIANTSFELEYKRLSAGAAQDQETGALGTLPKSVVAEKTAGESETQSATNAPADSLNAAEKPLDKMNREELDKIAVKEFGFNPSDYSNKAEIVKAIQDARNAE